MTEKNERRGEKRKTRSIMGHSSASCGITVAGTNGNIARRTGERLESPVAGIVLENYKVIGKVPERGTRLGVLHLITSNKRSSPSFSSSFPPLLSINRPSLLLFIIRFSAAPFSSRDIHDSRLPDPRASRF